MVLPLLSENRSSFSHMERQSCVTTGASIVRNPDLHQEPQCPVRQSKKKHQLNTHGGLFALRHSVLLPCVVGVMIPFVLALAKETAVLEFCQELESLFHDKLAITMIVRKFLVWGEVCMVRGEGLEIAKTAAPPSLKPRVTARAMMFLYCTGPATFRAPHICSFIVTNSSF